MLMGSAVSAARSPIKNSTCAIPSDPVQFQLHIPISLGIMSISAIYKKYTLVFLVFFIVLSRDPVERFLAGYSQSRSEF